ncbi:WecB/TagA/CpsF family glycosyltransferase [Stenotrophomonas sp. Sa5BUN4]|uniref:WecB/TagA/CpsF family glycosyltransferase n=1 Tax=Stenotrophomonas lacuserhaii TaxID=2760084 RepID=A0A8X8FR03_9GAMM|nr:WecB/TagA/CpsF family glycosyltransferase [Stenotrophomonas pennii]MBD7955057.1 WecB/TagA/CpsF family glycosyltransferase [Stenotrophomonas pennii]
MTTNFPAPVRLFGVHIDPLTLREAAAQVTNAAVRADRFHYVVTPNVDHIVMLDSDTEFAEVYRQASYVLADGWPVYAASRLLRRPVPERVAGSDLVPAVLEHAEQNRLPLSVFVLGGMGDVPHRAIDNVSRSYPSLRAAGSYSPPLGFEADESESSAIIDMIRASAANFIILGLGSPKQEKWVFRNRHLLPAGIAICAGATVDFMAGSVKRAPRWMGAIGLEWLYRLSSDPRRLFRRYARDAFIFPGIFIREALRLQRDRAG